MPGQRVVLRVYADAMREELALASLNFDSLGENQPLDQLLQLRNGASLKVVQWLSHGLMEQQVTADEADAGAPALELFIEGPTQTMRRWLIAGDPERNRLSSYIATWRYISARNAKDRDELFVQFTSEYTADPILRVSRSGDGHLREVPATAGAIHDLPDLDCQIRVLEFLPDAAMEGANAIPVNRSDRRRNPAAHIELRAGDKTESRWVFAKFPSFGHKSALPFEVTLECPIQGAANVPDFLIVTVNDVGHELWKRLGSKTDATSLQLNDAIEIAGSQYRFKAASFVPKARVVETYYPDPERKATAAVQVRYAGSDDRESSLWVPLGHHRRIQTKAGPLFVSLTKETDAKSPAHP